MKDAVLKGDQFEMKILEFLPDHMGVQVKESTGHPFNFVPRFLQIVYPEKVIAVKDTGIVAVDKGKTIEQANALFDQFHHLVTGPATQAESDELGKLAVLGGVREYPMRVKCASLAWHTLKAAMQAEHDVVSTE